MSVECDKEYLCGFTLIAVRSFLDSPDGCIVKVGGADESAHVVEFWNLGSGHYRIDAQGSCDEPLKYPESQDGQAWRNKKPIRLPPLRKVKAQRMKWKIEAEGAVEPGSVDPKVRASVSITGRENQGGRMLELSRKLPPDERLAFICGVR